MVSGHVTAHLFGCGMLGKSGGVSLFWHSHWMVSLFLGSVNIASPSTVLINCFDGLVGRYSLV